MSTVPSTAPPEVFLSYSTQDASKCDKLEDHLGHEGFTVWRDRVAISPGDSWVRAIFRGLDSADFVLPLLSAHALAAPWVRKEIDTAVIQTVVEKPRQVIIPVLLEPIQIPSELASLQAVILHTNFADGFQTLVARMRSPSPHYEPARSGEASKASDSILTKAVAQLGRTLFKVLGMRPADNNVGRKNLWDLHRELLRLQALTEEIGALDTASAAALWQVAGSLAPNPIPSPERVAQEGALAMSRRLHSSSTAASDERARISLTTRYIDVMGKVIKALRAAALEALPVSNPDIAELLTRLFQSKVSIYRVLQTAHAAGRQTEPILGHPTLLNYIEATRTLEARGLLQLIDADARAVAHDTDAGLNAFTEIAASGPLLIETITDLRRRLGRLLREETAQPWT
jgi:TIR domain